MVDASRKWAGRGIQVALVVLTIALVVYWVRSRVSSSTRDLHLTGVAAVPDTLAPGDMRIYSADSTLDLVLIGDKLAAGLSPMMVAKIRHDMDSSKAIDSGLGGDIAGLVTSSVAGAIGAHAQYPLKDLKDLRFENGHFVFEWKTGRDHVLFGGTSVNGKKGSDIFRDADALTFIAAVHARQNALGLASSGASGASAASTAPAVGHVFLIVLENQDYATTFGPGSAAPYLADTLVRAGALLRQYYGIGHSSLDNYIAMISGIAPNPATQADCGRYVEFAQRGVAPDGQPVGEGCVYPAMDQTIANQLADKGLTWKGYMEDMGKDPAREAATCGHVPIGASDGTEHAARNDQYAAKHDPFVYFHAIVDSASCAANVVPLDRMARDLESEATTPHYAFIVPNLCNDGHDLHCANGETGGLVGIDRFLKEWVPRITNSAAFKQDGLLIITFDEAMSADKTACCQEQPGPNTRSPGAGGPGGGRIGAVLLSPFITPGTVSDVPYNHYSMLKSVEEVFGLPYLLYAGQPHLAAFGSDVYTRPGGGR